MKKKIKRLVHETNYNARFNSPEVHAAQKYIYIVTKCLRTVKQSVCYTSKSQFSKETRFPKRVLDEGKMFG